MLWLTACLINEELYRERMAALADLDGDGVVAEADCDDLDDDVFPGAAEACNGIDDDCDGEADEDFAALAEACNGIDDDCDGEADEDFAALAETCNGIDDDCDGDTDEEAVDATAWHLDADGDGYGSPDAIITACDAQTRYVADASDCDDNDGDAHPGGTEVPYDGTDQDCDGADLADVDLDGHDAAEVGGDDCDDADPLTYPGADESWERGFTDSDCDGGLEELLFEFGTSVFTGRSAGGQAGASMAPLGDVDGDGRDEFAVAAYYDNSRTVYGGAVFIVRGEATGPLGDEETLESSEPYSFLGSGLDGGQDVDGDGRPDLLLGATGYGSGRGILTITLAASLDGGSTRDFLDVATGAILGEDTENYLGARAVFVGDVDGDGMVDLATSAPYASAEGLSRAGRVYVENAQALASRGDTLGAADAAVVWSGSEPEQLVGNNVHAIGDQDGDGLDDVAVSNGATELWVISGGTPSGAIPSLAMTRIADAVADTRMVGDIDGDGRVDLVVLGTSAALYTDLTASPSWSRDDAYASIESNGDAVTDVIDLTDRDDDGRAESMLFVESMSSVGSGWAGIVDGSDLRFGAAVQADEVRLQAVATRRSSAFGCRAVAAGDVAGDGALWFAVGGRLDDEGADDAGAVALLAIPE